MFAPYRVGAIAQGDSEAWFGMARDDGAGNPDVPNSLYCTPLEKDSGIVQGQAQVVTGGSASFTDTTNLQGVGSHYSYAAIMKQGSFVRMFIGGEGGWTQLRAQTVSYTVRHLILIATCDSQANPGNGIVGFDFVRYSPEFRLP